jgi:lipopolysaccharide transport system permease protein
MKSYFPESTSRYQGGSALSKLRTSLRSARFLYFRDLLITLVVRDMKLRYKRSLLGIVWTLLNPLAQLLVFSFIFRLVLPVEIPNYVTFIFSGVLAWNWFQASLSQATSTIVDNRDLIKQPGFPTAILPTVTVTSHLVHFILALPILLLFLVLGGYTLTTAILAFPLVMGMQFILTLGFAYLLATFHVTFRDTQYLLGVALHLLFFLTPVFYNASAIPLRYQPLYNLNPMVRIIESYHTILIEGRAPDYQSMLALAVVAVFLLSLGFVIFSRANYRFVDQLSWTMPSLCRMSVRSSGGIIPIDRGRCRRLSCAVRTW